MLVCEMCNGGFGFGCFVEGKRSCSYRLFDVMNAICIQLYSKFYSSAAAKAREFRMNRQGVDGPLLAGDENDELWCTQPMVSCVRRLESVLVMTFVGLLGR